MAKESKEVTKRMMVTHHDSQNAVRLENGKPSERAGRKAPGLSHREDLGYGSKAAKRMEHLLFWISKAQKSPMGGGPVKETLSKTMAPGFARHSKGLVILFLLLSLMIPTLLFFAVDAAAQITLAWTASTSSSVTGYYIYYGTTSGSLGSSIKVGNVTTYAMTGLSPGATYYFEVAAYDAAGDQSGDSNEVSYTVPTGTCTYSLSSTSATVSASGGTGSVNVTTQSGCSWSASASSGASWLTVAPTSGSGSGPVNYTVTANSSTSTRTAASTIAGLSFTVTQAAAAPPTTQNYTITASAGTNGSISPSGSVTVNSGASKTFTIKAASGCAINSVTVDGKSVGRLNSYTFSNVTANHTIRATFRSRWR